MCFSSVDDRVKRFIYKVTLPGDSWNYMPPILVPSSVKPIAAQILVITKLNGRK